VKGAARGVHPLRVLERPAIHHDRERKVSDAREDTPMSIMKRKLSNSTGMEEGGDQRNGGGRGRVLHGKCPGEGATQEGEIFTKNEKI